MFIVYALKNEELGWIYVGLTSNLERRFNEHNAGKVKSTKNRRPYKIIYTEAFETRQVARLREKYLKQGDGKRFLKTL